MVRRSRATLRSVANHPTSWLWAKRWFFAFPIANWLLADIPARLNSGTRECAHRLRTLCVTAFTSAFRRSTRMSWADYSALRHVAFHCATRSISKAASRFTAGRLTLRLAHLIAFRRVTLPSALWHTRVCAHRCHFLHLTNEQRLRPCAIHGCAREVTTRSSKDSVIARHIWQSCTKAMTYCWLPKLQRHGS